MLQDTRIAANLVVQYASIQRNIRCVLAYLYVWAQYRRRGTEESGAERTDEK